MLAQTRGRSSARIRCGRGHMVVVGAPASAGGKQRRQDRDADQALVVIFQENVSFDHYFGTYPEAANTDGRRSPRRPGTPAVQRALDGRCCTQQPEPRRPAEAPRQQPDRAPGEPGGQVTCDQDHNYSDEQKAFDGGAMDKFVQSVGTDGGTHDPGRHDVGGPVRPETSWTTTTATPSPALWNYAQHFAMSDNSFGTTFGPSAPGAINLVSGNTGGVDRPTRRTARRSRHRRRRTPTHARRPGRLLADERRPALLRRLLDPRRGRADRHEHRRRAERRRAQLGLVPGRLPPDDQLRRRGDRSRRPADQHVHPRRVQRASSPTAVPHSATRASATRCTRSASALGETATDAQYGNKDDYIAHHEPFQYYASTANPHHLRAGEPHSAHRHRHADYVGRRAAVRHRRTTSTTRATSTRSSRAIAHGYAAGVRLPAVTLPEGARLPGRPRGVLRTRRRAAVRRQRDQRARADARLVEHRGDRRLRRLRRLVRPRLQRRHQPVALPGRQPDEHGSGRSTRRTRPRSQCGPSRRPPRRSPASRAAAATAPACRCSSSRRGRGRTTSTTT